MNRTNFEMPEDSVDMITQQKQILCMCVGRVQVPDHTDAIRTDWHLNRVQVVGMRCWLESSARTYSGEIKLCV